jgi:hypothetical protein
MEEQENQFELHAGSDHAHIGSLDTKLTHVKQVMLLAPSAAWYACPLPVQLLTVGLLSSCLCCLNPVGKQELLQFGKKGHQ